MLIEEFIAKENL